jgi:sugar phosphate isomerase/epimerase
VRDVIDPRVSALGASLSEYDLAEDIAFCLESGFTQYGVPAYKLDRAGWDAGIEALQESGLVCSTVMHSAAFTLWHESAWPAQEQRLLAVLDAARALNAGCVYITSGPAGALGFEEAAEAFTRAVAPAAAHARAIGVPLTVEPTVPVYAHISFIHNMRDLIDVARLSGLGVCLDVFPVFQEGGFLDSIREAGSLIQFVQIGNFVPGEQFVPNRAELDDPDGVVPVASILSAVLDTGYAGAIDIELVGPRIRAAGEHAALLRAAAWVTDYLATRAPA